MDSQSTIEQRVKDFRGFCASNRITIKEVTTRAELNYDSVIVNMNRHDLSDERMSILEETAIEISEDQEAEKAIA